MSTLSKARFLTNEKRLLIALRSVAALVLVAFFVSRPAHFETPWQFWFTLVLFALTNVVLFFEELKVLRLPRSHFLIFAFDVAMISVLMIFLGERSSEFYVVFFMTIFVAAASKSVRYAFAVSLMMSALYWFVASRGAADILPFSSAFLVRVVLFFIVSMFAGYLSEEAEARKTAAEDLAKRARKAEDARGVVEAANVAKEERLRVLFERAPDGYYVSDLKGVLVDGNRAAEELTGYRREELIGKSFPKLKLLSAGQIPKAAALLAKNALGLPTGPDEFVLNRKDGTPINVVIRTFPIKVAGESLVLGAARDITERRQAEEAVRTSGRFLVLANKHTQMGPLLREFVSAAKELTRCAAVGIRILDKGGNIPYQAYEGFSRRFYELESPLSIKSDQCMCINVIKGTTDSELPFYTKGGSFYMNGTTRFLATVSEEEKGRTRNACNEFGYESVALVPIRVADQVLGIVHVADPGEDMVPLEMVERLENVAIPLGTAIERIRVQQDLRQTLEQLRQSQKTEAVGRLAGGIAHDFSNLLTAVTGYSELLLDKLDTKDSLRGWVEKIWTAGRRAAGLVAQLLAFSRKQVLRPMTLDLANILAETDDMLRRLIGEDIELSAFLEPGLACIKADRTQIEQILMNLAVNARDAMPDGGKLTVETSNVELGEEHVRRGWDITPGPYVMLAVTDTGCGMDKGTLEQIFDPFFTTKEVGKGTGLGLSTVYGIVKQSGGDIRAYSELGHGTTFKICLPQATERTESEEAEPEPRTSLAGAETILLSEDDAVVRELARQILIQHGYDVLVTANGSEALRLCEEHEGAIHLLLTDVVMPGMGDRQLAERLAALRPETKVLYMSGYTDDAIVHHGVLVPGTPFIAKPFTPESLARKVRNLLDAPPGEKQ